MLIAIQNHHIEGCGTPPAFADEPHLRTCFFENFYGEQAVIQFNRNDGTCRLWMGDVGWEEELTVDEFRGQIVVRFKRNREERRSNPKMNTQFAGLEELTDADPEIKKRVTAELYKVLRKQYGKPRLTDEECESLLETPVISKHEMVLIRAFWGFFVEGQHDSQNWIQARKHRPRRYGKGRDSGEGRTLRPLGERLQPRDRQRP